jgi:hypothetical protein
LNVDNPVTPPDWVRVQEPAASAGMASAGLYYDGKFVYTAATDSGSGKLCSADLTNETAPVNVRCVAAQSAIGGGTGRMFAADGVPGFLAAGGDAGLLLYDVRSGPPSAAINATRSVTPASGVAQNMLAAGPFLYSTLGNSSALPLGEAIGLDGSPDVGGLPLFSLVGSLSDADSGSGPNRSMASGDNLVITQGDQTTTAFIIQLF